MAEELGAGYVSVLPSLKGFSRLIQRQLRKALRGVKAQQVPLDPKVDDTAAAAAGVRASSIAEKAAPPVNLKVEVDRRRLRALAGLVSRTIGSAVSAGLKTAGVAVIVGGVSALLTGLTTAAVASIPALVGLGTAAVKTVGLLAIVPGALAAIITAANVVKIGMIGVGDAFKAIIDNDPSKLAEALKKLSPNARLLVKTISQMRQAFKDLQLDVQNALFRDTAVVFRELSFGLLPMAHQRFTELASVINNGVIKAVRGLNTAANQATLSSVLAQSTQATGNLLTALGPVGKAVLDVLGVSSKLVAKLSTGLANAISRAAARLSAFATSGGLEAWFLQGLEAAKLFAGLGKDILGILNGIARAASGGNAGLFTFFTKLNELINSGDTQASLSGFFAEMSRLGNALMPVLGALARALVPVAAGIADIAEAFAPSLVKLLDVLGPVLGNLAPSISALAPVVVALAGVLEPLAAILAALIRNAAPGITAFLEGLASGLGPLAMVAPAVGKALGDLLAAAAPLVSILGSALAGVLAVLAPILSNLFAVLTPVLGVLAQVAAVVAQALIPAFAELFAASAPMMVTLGKELAAAFAPLVPVIAEVAKIFAEELVKMAPKITALMEQLVPVIAEVARVFSEHLITVLRELIPQLPQLISSGLNLIMAINGLLLAAAPLLPIFLKLGALVAELVLKSGLLQIMIFLLVKALTWITIIIYVFHHILEAIIGVVGTVTEAFGKLFEGIGKVVDKVKTTMEGLPGKIKAAVGNLGSLLLNAGKNVVEGLIDGIKSKFGALGNIADNIAGIIRDRLPFSPAKTGPLSGSGNPYHSGQVIASDVAAGVHSKMPTVTSAANQLAGQFGAGGSAGASTAGTAAAGFTIDTAGSRLDQLLVEVLRQAIRDFYGGDPDAALASGS